MLVVRARGKASHGANPHGGENAATRALRPVKSLAPIEQEDVFEALLDLPTSAERGLGSRVRMKYPPHRQPRDRVDGPADVHFRPNVRDPVTWTGEQLKAKCENKLAKLAKAGGLASRTAHPSTSLWITRS